MAVLLEQPTDWAEPGAHPVVPGVFRIPLALGIHGLKAVNIYLVETAAGPVLIDSGWADEQTRAALTRSLDALGYRIGDIREFVITHAHWDHYTHALALRNEFGIRVRLGIGERFSIRAYRPDLTHYPEQIRRLRRAGAVELAERILATPRDPAHLTMPFGEPDEWLTDNQVIALPDRDLTVQETPGHTRGHIVVRDLGAGLLFSGDHILTRITPSIGLELVPEALPLRSFLDSLALLRVQPDALVLPAHGPVGQSAHVRIDELIAHHEQRLVAVRDEVAAGRANAFQIARQLPWTRHRTRFDDLDDLSQMLAVLEVQAHLDVLVEASELHLTGSIGDVADYAVA